MFMFVSEEFELVSLSLNCMRIFHVGGRPWSGALGLRTLRVACVER